MTDKDSITLPREVVQEALEALEFAERNHDGEQSLYTQEIKALRTALAAEPQKPEPVAWQERHFFPKVGEWTHWYDCRPRMADYPREQIEQNGVRYQWRPLYAAPPDAPTVKESLTHPGYVIGSHWLETAYSRVCAGEAEADVLRDCGWERVDEALRRDAERLTDEQIDSATAKERDALLDHIYEYGTAAEGILERIRKLARAAIDAAMKEDKT